MNEPVKAEKKKFNVKQFGLKTWQKGLYTALKEEVCTVIPSELDDAALQAIDIIIKKILS